MEKEIKKEKDNEKIKISMVLLDENKIKFTGNFCPKPYERHRKGKFSIFDPLSAYKKEIKKLIKDEFDKFFSKPFYKYCYVSGNFYLKIPESFSNKKKLYACKGKVKPLRKDIDNIAKTILDCMNKIVYEDDGQVIKINLDKSYDLNNHFEIIIEFEEENISEITGRMTKEEKREWKSITEYSQKKN